MIPVVTKVRVAIMDRVESRPIPQTACPLVHPFARDVPSPTRIPAIMSVVLLAELRVRVDSGLRYL